MSTTPNAHGHWREPKDDGRGQPIPFATCSYCGSLSPDDFLALIEAGASVGGSDWKYGFPHKFYVTAPNPKPDEVRVTGGGYREDGTFYDTRGTFPTLHLKFYSEHLEHWPRMSEEAVRDRIKAATGIAFKVEDGKLMYAAPYAGYQKS